MIVDPIFYLIAIPSLIYVGVSKAGFLSGTAFVGVPLLALVISPIQAAAIMLPILIAMDMLGLFAYRQKYDSYHLKLTIPTAILGIGIGWFTASWVNESMVRLLVGVIAVLFALDYFFKWRPAKKPGKKTAYLLSTVSGFTSFVSHSGSPPLQMYLLPQNLDKVIYAGTTVVYFAIGNLVKLIPYIALGQLSGANLTTSLILLPVAPIGMLLGLKLVKSVPQAPFYRITYACVLIAGIKLSWDGLSYLIG